jgi:hypothetical protein
MLRETRHIAQVPGDRFRRCFLDENLDLVVWYDPAKRIHGFQLAYDSEGLPRVVTWTPERGFFHAALDVGEESPLANRSPILTPSDDYDADQLLATFVSAAAELPVAEKAFIEARLMESSANR